MRLVPAPFAPRTVAVVLCAADHEGVGGETYVRRALRLLVVRGRALARRTMAVI